MLIRRLGTSNKHDFRPLSFSYTVYIAVSRLDARFARTCIASIRYFHPDAHIELIRGGPIESGLREELHKYWNVELTDVPAGDYGWGFVKLEPLFFAPGARFLVLDSDTAFAGPLLDPPHLPDADFVVDDEQLPEKDAKRLYYDWDRLGAFDRDVQPAHRAFNVGQWFGVSGALSREDFGPWLEWSMPRRLRRPDLFMGGDQGVMNYVVLKKEALEGLRIERRTLMRWPGHSMDDLDVESVKHGRAPPLVIHWAGMKKVLLRDMVGGEILQFFEDWYYQHLPYGRLRRRLALWRHVWTQIAFALTRRVRLRLAIWGRRIHATRPRAAPTTGPDAVARP